ncbi:MAG: hypothetical protein ACRDBM_01430 [Sporomusa sp.]
MIELNFDEGVNLRVCAVWAGSDLCVVITGGDCPHIGSISIGIPRPSLRQGGTLSATVSTFNMEGHKDDHIGNLFAHRLSAEFSCKTVVTCGIHVDNADEAVIGDFLLASPKLLLRLVNCININM